MVATMTIFTPTYNRGYLIENLYQSLVAQTCQDFEWLVIDDGSTDDTEELIVRLAEEAPFPVRYLKVPNGGKQRAHDLAVQMTDAELFFCVDSDDALVPTAVADVLDCWAPHRDDPRYAGVIAMRGSEPDVPLGTAFPSGLAETTMWDIYYKHHHRGDTALVYRTDVLKRYPFDVRPDEKFVAETLVYFRIDQSYVLAVLDKVIWITKYLPDGYSQNVRKFTRENPRGYMQLKREMVDYAKGDPLLRLQSASLFLVGAHFAGVEKEAAADLPTLPLRLLAPPVAAVLVRTFFSRRGEKWLTAS